MALASLAGDGWVGRLLGADGGARLQKWLPALGPGPATLLRPMPLGRRRGDSSSGGSSGSSWDGKLAGGGSVGWEGRLDWREAGGGGGSLGWGGGARTAARSWSSLEETSVMEPCIEVTWDSSEVIRLRRTAVSGRRLRKRGSCTHSSETSSRALDFSGFSKTHSEPLRRHRLHGGSSQPSHLFRRPAQHLDGVGEHGRSSVPVLALATVDTGPTTALGQVLARSRLHRGVRAHGRGGSGWPRTWRAGARAEGVGHGAGSTFAGWRGAGRVDRQSRRAGGASAGVIEAGRDQGELSGPAV